MLYTHRKGTPLRDTLLQLLSLVCCILQARLYLTYRKGPTPTTDTVLIYITRNFNVFCGIRKKNPVRNIYIY